MANSVISVGNKIEFTEYSTRYVQIPEEEKRTYISQVFDIDDEVISCAMPIYEGHLIPLEKDAKYEAYFYTPKGIYKCIVNIENRNKEGNIYTVTVRPLSELVKFQRREYFRLDIMMDVVVTSLTETEVKNILQTKTLPEQFHNESETTTSIDLSGGGIRLFSKKQYEKNSFVNLNLVLNMTSGPKNINILGRVISSEMREANSYVYDDRIQFKALNAEVREMIVKFIFEEQRRIRKKERGI